jgi:hypothetical protein
MPLFLILLLFVSSCSYYSGPAEKVQIAESTQINHLSGLYQNAGDPSGYLSQFIWGKDPLHASIQQSNVEHHQIEVIQVMANDNNVIIKAISNGCVLHQAKYIHGKDFEINNGKILLHAENFLISRGSDDPLLGPSSQKVSLMLDVSGDGIYRDESFAAGLVYLLIPVAVSNVSEIRFEKSVNGLIYRHCVAR